MTMHAMTLTNVVMTDNLRQRVASSSPQVLAHSQLEPVIFKLATLNPTWKFTADSSGTIGGNDSRIFCTDFHVSCDGEPLGRIFRRYESRDYQICVQNDRIAKSMERSPYFYKTKDPAKAIAKVKKYFSPQTTPERIELARKAAGDAVREADWSKTRELRQATDKVEKAAIDYVMHDGFEVFMEFVKERSPSQYDELRKSRDTVMETEFELQTIDMVQKVLGGTHPGVVVIRHGSNYIVTVRGGATAIYNDQTLPEWMRGGLGMLKLIEKGQFITQTGMRATDDTFVLIGEDLTDVSEGESK